MEEGEIEQFEEIGSSRGDGRLLSLSLSALEEESGRRRTSDGPPTVPDPIFVTLVRLSVYPLSVRTRPRLARGAFRVAVAPMFPSITLIMSN